MVSELFLDTKTTDTIKQLTIEDLSYEISLQSRKAQTAIGDIMRDKSIDISHILNTRSKKNPIRIDRSIVDKIIRILYIFIDIVEVANSYLQMLTDRESPRRTSNGYVVIPPVGIDGILYQIHLEQSLLMQLANIKKQNIDTYEFYKEMLPVKFVYTHDIVDVVSELICITNTRTGKFANIVNELETRDSMIEILCGYIKQPPAYNSTKITIYDLISYLDYVVYYKMYSITTARQDDLIVDSDIYELVKLSRERDIAEINLYRTKYEITDTTYPIELVRCVDVTCTSYNKRDVSSSLVCLINELHGNTTNPPTEISDFIRSLNITSIDTNYRSKYCTNKVLYTVINSIKD